MSYLSNVFVSFLANMKTKFLKLIQQSLKLMLNFLLSNAFELAKKVGSKVIVVITSKEVRERSKDGVSIFVAPKSYATLLESAFWSEKEIESKLVTISQAKEYIPTFLYLKGIELSGKVVGVLDIEAVKAIFISELDKSNMQKALMECAERVNSRALRSLLAISINIVQKGREGRKIGTAFIIGDEKEVLKRSRQLVLNPYEGHPVKDRDVKNPANWESIMEFSQLDGVFVLDREGIILCAGRYLDVQPKDVKIKKGLGARHLACAAITRETEAIAVVVSQSGGDITIYKDGREILEINPSII